LQPGACGAPITGSVPWNGLARRTADASSSCSVATTAPASSDAPSVRRKRITPAACAVSGRNIFITSISAYAVPAAMCVPFSTSWRASLPGVAVRSCDGSFSFSNTSVRPSYCRRRPVASSRL
jgi:hypothetical protein